MQKTTSAARTRDMTSGSPIRHILGFAAPLLIGNIFQQIYTMIDTMEMGYFIGDSAISAIGAVASLYGLLLELTISMNSGYAIIITQAFGARDPVRLRRSIAGAAVLNGILTLLVSVFSLLFLRPMLRFMNTPAGIFDQSYAYMFILCGGMLATVGYNMFASILRAVGNSRTPLYVLIASSFLNVGLDLLLILGLKLGIVGTALGTVLAQLFSALLCGGKLLRDYRSLLPRKGDFAASRALWPALAASGGAMAMMMCVVSMGNLVFTRANNVLGESVIAAHSAAHKIINTFMQPLGSLATASSTFVSQNWGARRYDRIRPALRQVMGLEAGWGVVACVIVYLTGGMLLRLITGTQDPSILSNGVMAMRISMPFFPVLGVLLCLRTSMQSMGCKAAPVASSCVELLMKGLGASLLIPAYGYLGSCITEPLTWTSMTVFLVIAFLAQQKKIFSPVQCKAG